MEIPKQIKKHNKNMRYIKGFKETLLKPKNAPPKLEWIIVKNKRHDTISKI